MPLDQDKIFHAPDELEAVAYAEDGIGFTIELI